jgi:hypothetical protein
MNNLYLADKVLANHNIKINRSFIFNVFEIKESNSCLRDRELRLSNMAILSCLFRNILLKPGVLRELSAENVDC